MRIADRQASDFIGRAVDVQGFADDLPIGSGHGDGLALKCHLPHAYLNGVAGVILNLRRHRAAERLNCEGLGLHVVRIIEVSGEDPQSVATLFRLASIRIEDLDPVAAGVIDDGSVQQTIRTHTEVTITDKANPFRR